MPKNNFYYDPKIIKLTPEEWTELGRTMAVPLAKVMSTESHRLSPSTDIDFIPIPYPDGYIGLPIAVEIETIGYPERKAKVTEDMMRYLKGEFLWLLMQVDINVDGKKPLIWVKYVDPDGHHI